MKTYGEVEIYFHRLNLGTIWRWVISFTLRPVYPKHSLNMKPGGS